MPKFTMHSLRSVGLDFVEYLGENDKRGITDKIKLRDIYNNEFRGRDGIKDPNFSSLLYALRKSNKASIWAGQVHFDQKVRVVQDQWRRPRGWKDSSAGSLSNGSSLDRSESTVSSFSSPGLESGVRARRRLANELLQNLNKNKSVFISEKGGIRITSDHEVVNGTICFNVESVDVYELKLYVENTGQSSSYFTYYSPLHFLQCFIFNDEEKVTRAKPLLLHPGAKYEIKVKFMSNHVGFYPATMAFEFKPDALVSSTPFHIVRYIEAVRRTRLAMELAPTEPYKPYKISYCKPVPFVVDEGEQPESLAIQHLKPVVPLSDYRCPTYVIELAKFLNNFNCSPSLRDKLQSLKELLESPLSFQNYTERFQILLWLEEIQMEVDIKRYNMENEPMNRDHVNKRLLVLKVPGVAENRPSVLRGDHLLVTKAKDVHIQPTPKYKGYVHCVELEQVKLGFSKKLQASFIDGMKFNVEFTINRLPLRLQQRAVELAVQHKLEEVLFPTGSRVVNQEPPPSLSLFDRKLEENPEQYKAVVNIVAGVSKPAPYLVFGPPGTGKTVTIVEAIKQVRRSQTTLHILACAPSNSAADLLCEKILEHGESHQVYRLYASSRDPRAVPLDLLDNCNLIGDSYVFPCKEDLMEYKILVTTVVTAGRLVSGGLPSGHFSHIFVDEAGHAVESECIIAMAGLLRAETGQLVLAGDPKQLGPILRSPVAIQHGLGLSLLERLMNHNPLYQKDQTGTFNNCFVTKLLQNYRSHRAILKIPNELFYDAELQPCADEMITSSYCRWEYLPKMGFPVIFHGVIGKDEREANSPSFFNTTEIEIIVDYLKKLLQTAGKKGISKLSPKEIGIIAPYRRQVQKIRKAIGTHDSDLKYHKDIKMLKVGSVEEFQGQERRVIIVSTVRSSGKYVSIDRDFNIGFLKNEKRFNVAMTRAKALLIVVGNPIILRPDRSWGKFIDYCTENEGYKGFDYASVEGTEEVVERLAALSIQMEPKVETEESVVQQHLDPEWRNEQY